MVPASYSLRCLVAHCVLPLCARVACRWKRQATAAANAVIEAKDEVLLRKKELDSTKDKMDTLIDKLYGKTLIES